MDTAAEDPDAPVVAERRLDELVDDAATRLAENMRTGYTEMFESTLADDVLAAFLPTAEAERATVLEYGLSALVRERMRGLVTVDCLVAEYDFASYTATNKMADILLAEIRRQDNQADALRRLVLDQITDQAEYQRNYVLDDDAPDEVGEEAIEAIQAAICAGHPADGVTWCGACGYTAPPPGPGVCGHPEGGQAYCREFIGVRTYPVGDRCRKHRRPWPQTRRTDPPDRHTARGAERDRWSADQGD